jgi:cysteinyl-tRNA synthetase
VGCSSTPSASTDGGGTDGAGDAQTSNDGGALDGAADGAAGDGAAPTRGFPVAGLWVSFYGGAMGVDLVKTASTFHVINIDADPDTGNFTPAEIATLRAQGKNVVLSYMNVGACEDYRSYWSTKPQGFESCQSSGALTTAYGGYPNEKWANLSNAAYRALIVDYVAPRLFARGVDGIFMDNLEVVEHGANAAEGPCDAACAQGGLDLVWALRQRFPDKLIVMQNATGTVTRSGVTHGVGYPTLLDGISHEEVYSNGGDAQSRAEMLAWKALGLKPGGRAFWLAVEEYVGACNPSKKAAAQTLEAQARGDGLEPYVTDASGQQITPCFW